MGRAIVVTSGKGGVGKTTSTANLGVALAMQGHSAVIIDADIGLRNLDVVMGLEEHITFTLVDVIDKKCRTKQALIKDKRFPNLSLLAAAQMADIMAIQPAQMAKLVEELAKDFEFVLVDSPAGIERGFQNAIAGAKEAIVVTTPEVSSVRDADRIIGLLKAANFKEPKLLLNKIRPEMMKRREMMDIEDVIDILDIELIGVVAEAGEIVIASNRGEPVASDEASLTGKAYHDIAKRLLGQQVPFPSFIKKESVFTRIAGFLKASV
ncbi:MAG: septum site-determining protein MinD [Eubacteriaceae bacterium]|nr:septum site-determining protein MinD [Eubacteriaceae bacterium]